jgi:2-polyprenyl-3-methyl-5-hydroxy-6-metoxy-1,4-benzoquinol methylase
MSTAFAKEQYDQAYDDGIEHHWWHLARNRILLREIRNCVVASPRVLDVGCGRGIAVKYLRAHGIDCAGVELAHARPLAGVESHVRYGQNATQLPEDERARVEVVTLLDVVEHVIDPATFIANIVAAFPRLSELIVTVPACAALWSNYDEYFGHFHRYDLAMLRALAQATKLQVINTSYFFHALYPPARLLAAMHRKRSTRVDPPRGTMKLLHRGVSLAMLLDYYFVPGVVPGASAIARFGVARPPAGR